MSVRQSPKPSQPVSGTNHRVTLIDQQSSPSQGNEGIVLADQNTGLSSGLR